MTNLIITGANGKMGKVIQSIVANRNDCNIVAGVDLNTEDNGHFPIYSSISFWCTSRPPFKFSL